MHSRSRLRQLTAQALRQAPSRGAACLGSTLASAAPPAALSALRDTDGHGHSSSSSSWRLLVAAAAAGACGAAVASCESSGPVATPAAAAAAQLPHSSGGLLSRETRLRAFYDYERRLRERSGPDKVRCVEKQAAARARGPPERLLPPRRRSSNTSPASRARTPTTWCACLA